MPVWEGRSVLPHKRSVRESMSFHRHKDSFLSTVPQPNVRSQEIVPDSINYPPLAWPPAANDREVTMRLAESEGERQQAEDLINRMYSWRGYGSSHVIPRHEAHSTFVAMADDRDVIGTITLCVDSEKGLAADAIFREDIDRFRSQPGAMVCELTKLAFDTELPSRELLASLFHVVFIYGKMRYNCTDLFIEVNPRHRRFYQMMLDFEPVGELKTNEKVNAPSQLMWLSVSNIAKLIAKHTSGSRAQSMRSLYPLFLSPTEEQAVNSRLLQLEPKRRSAAAMPVSHLYRTRLPNPPPPQIRPAQPVQAAMTV